MKKYFWALLLVVFLIVDLYLINAIRVDVTYSKNLENPGYILKYTEDESKYYFAEQTKYKDSYNNQVVFKNSEGDKVSLDKQNFIHFDNGAISSFTKGVLADLKTIDTDPITYYNISAGKVIRKLANDRYVTKNLNNDIEFSSLIWRISPNKYLVAGKDLKILFSDETTKELEGYVEIEYFDNEIVKIYNNAEKYETISSDVYIQVDGDVKINLGNKCISKNDEIKMTLENMVIDSDDNVTIIDIDEYKQEENKEEEEEKEEEIVEEEETVVGGDTNQIGNNGGNAVGGNSTANSGTNVTNNGGTTVNIGGDGSQIQNGTVNDSNGGIGGSVTDNGTDENESGDGNNDNGNNSNGGQTTINEGPIETELEDGLTVITPKYTVTEFKVSSTGLTTTVEIEDEEARLVGGTKTKIINNFTGKVDYEMAETGETIIKVDTNSLLPDTSYTLAMEATYAIDKAEYNRYFVYKVFRTPILGVSLDKELFTENSLAFYVNFDPDSEVSKLDVELVETEQTIEDILNTAEHKEKVEFENLTPNTEYTIKVKNICVGNVKNDETYSYTFKTLKSKPKLDDGKTHGNILVETDKWNSRFVLTLPEIIEGAVDLYRYEIYTQTEGKEELVYAKSTTDKNLVLNVDEENIFRNVDYYAKVFADFYDNEKIFEYEFASTETSFILNTSKMPTIRFEPGSSEGVTFNSINGTLIIDDEGKTIIPQEADIEVTYTSTTAGVDDSGSVKLTNVSSDLRVPINIENLKAHETYKLSVYANYNLGEGPKRGYIGSILVNTKKAVPLNAIWTLGEEGINVSLKLSSTGNSDREAETLYRFKLELYLGQEGASKVPRATAIITDSGVENFEGELKNKYYDTAGLITQKTFGLSDNEIMEIEQENEYCTIVIKEARDTVTRYNEQQAKINRIGKTFENDIPITENTSKQTYPIAQIKIKNPSSSENAIKANLVTKQRVDSVDYDNLIATADYANINEITSNAKINASTPVALTIEPNIPNSTLIMYSYFEYFIYDKNGELVGSTGLLSKNTEENRAPIAMFLISNGTSNEVDADENMRRGDTYYYKYYAYENPEMDGKYPTDEEGIDYWTKMGMPNIEIRKQEPVITMYPSILDNDSITYKYNANDVDNAIQVENGVKYFYQYYANVPIYENNRKILNDETNTQDNGFWTVKFDRLASYEKNYDFEVKILTSTMKDRISSYKNLAKQRVETILENFDFNPDSGITQTTGIKTIISLNDLTATQRANLVKARVELTEQNNPNQKIIIEKTLEDLIINGWTIDINYVELANNNPDLVLKDKRFNITVKMYYLTNIAGYDIDLTNSRVAYQTVNLKWLSISRNGEFLEIPVSEAGIVQPNIYSNHTYTFESARVAVKENGEEVAYLNYADNGLVRKINGVEGVAILPKEVKISTLDSSKVVSFVNVVPAINSAEDLTRSAGPTNVTIWLNNIYTKDTILDGVTNYTIYADVYEKDDRLESNVISTGTFTNSNGRKMARIRNLEKGKEYYFMLYVKQGQNKVYLYDIDKNKAGVHYSFKTLSTIAVSNPKVEFEKVSTDIGTIKLTHSATIRDGYKGFKYEICDEAGNLITEQITYYLKAPNSEEDIEALTTSNGIIEIDIEEFEKFGEIYINANRGSFFEYGTKYIIYITPMVEKESGEVEPIGEPRAVPFSHEIMKPEVLLYAKRVKALENEDSYIEWNISISDENYLIKNNTIHYKLYKNGSETPFDDRDVEINEEHYLTIQVNSETNGVSTELEDSYRLVVTYEYYTSNINDEQVENETLEKRLAKIENGISVGNVNMQIINNIKVKMKFYDSYELSKVKQIKCSIYDTNGRILRNVPIISNVVIEDKTGDVNDPHKSITFEPDFLFEPATSYKIAVKLLDENNNELATIEPENPVTNNE